MTRVVDLVVKLGGSALEQPDLFARTLVAIARASHHRRLLVVPGGGPFADVVRDVDRRLNLSPSAAHWMAILAMDQYAELIASRIAGGTIVRQPGEIAAAIAAVRVPVLAPSRWLRDADPLAHSWSVT